MISNRMAVVEYVKLLKRQLTWVVVGLAIVQVLALTITQYFTVKNATGATEEALSSLRWPNVLPATLGSLTSMGTAQMLVIVLFGAVIAQEYSWRTLHMWLARGSVSELLGGESVVKVKVADPAEAARLLRQLPAVKDIEAMNGHGLVVRGVPSETVVAHLTSHGVVPGEVSNGHGDLESVFLALTES